MKQLFFLFVCVFVLFSCKSRQDQSGLPASDQLSIRAFCDCASPLAAITLMVMMKDTASVNMDSLARELDAVASTYSSCAVLISPIEKKCMNDSLYEASVVRFVIDSVPNCSILMLGKSSSSNLLEPESPLH